MSKERRIFHALEPVQIERQHLDDAIHMHPIRLAVLTSVWIAATFIVSCLMAAAPVLETVICGITLGAAVYMLFLILYRVAGEILFPGSLGPAARALRRAPSAATAGPRAAAWVDGAQAGEKSQSEPSAL